MDGADSLGIVGRCDEHASPYDVGKFGADLEQRGLDDLEAATGLNACVLWTGTVGPDRGGP